MKLFRKIYHKLMDKKQDFQQQRIIGRVTFRRTFSKQIESQLITKSYTHNKLSEDELKLNLKLEEGKYWGQLFQYFEEAKFQKFHIIGLVEGEKLLKSISMPMYSELKMLIFFACEIENFEFLEFIDAHKLASLMIIKTQGFVFKSLYKIIWLKFQEFCFYWNKGIKLSLNRVKTIKVIKILDIRDDKMHQDISIYANAQFQQIKMVKLQQKNDSIRQQKVLKALQRKSPVTTWVKVD